MMIVRSVEVEGGMEMLKFFICFLLVLLASVFLAFIINARIKVLMFSGVLVVLVFAFCVGMLIGLPPYRALMIGACVALLTALSMLALNYLVKIMISANHERD